MLNFRLGLEQLKNSTIYVSFENNKLVAYLLGGHNANLDAVEKAFNVEATSRGNVISLTGDVDSINLAKETLEVIYKQIEKNKEIGAVEVEQAIRLVVSRNRERKSERRDSDVVIKTPFKQIVPFTENQKTYVKTLLEHDMVFSTGPAGTGKTFLAVAVAVEFLLAHKVDRIILSRPALEAGEKIGFLPGDMKEKVDPYLRPLYDSLYSMLGVERVNKYIETNVIEIAPLAFMRGRTLSNAFVILDEAQNTTPVQLKMFLTRLGENSHMAINGDLTQVDLPHKETSGLSDAIAKLRRIKEVKFIEFDYHDVVRHDLVSKIIRAYDEW